MKHVKTIRSFLAVIIISLIAVTGCDTNDPASELSLPPQSGPQTGGVIVLGKKLENPYSVENMKKAYSNLISSGKGSGDLEIKTTHYYVRFLPANESEVEILENENLELWDHPLLYEIKQMGNWYHDPSIPDGLPTWQYTVVDKQYKFPSVKYEILSDLYMVNEHSDELQSGRITSSIWDELEYEALRITHNLDEKAADSGARTAASKWRPYGRIRVEERTGNVDRGDVPVRYCKVRARKLLKFASANTSTTTGVFSITEDFKGKVNYSLEFETADHKVTNALGFSVNYNGPKSDDPWYLDIGFNDEESWVCATILNAIYHFRTQASIHRIKLPGVATTVKVRPKFESGRSNAVRVARHYPLVVSLLVRNDVVIYTKFSSGNKLETDDFYSVTMHELAHVSHFLKSPVNAPLSMGMPGESWATAVEYYFTLPYYPSIVSNLIDQSRANIICCGDDSWKYTPFFIDLRDNTNQRTSRGGSTDWANDDVSGYTLEQMQLALDKRTTLGGVCEHLKNNYSNSSEGNLNTLVEFYDDIKDNH